MPGELYVGMVFGGVVAAVWSFLMARYVAGPRAKQLMVGTLRGDTPQDKLIVAEIRENLVRPEITAALSAVPVPEFDLEPIMAQFEEMKRALPDEIGQHIEMQIKAQKAVEVKQFNKLLEESGVDLDAAKGELIAFAENQLPPELVMTKRLLTAKVPKQVRENHPEWAWLVDTAREAGGDYMMQRMAARFGGGEVVVEGANRVRGGSFRPGLV